MGIREFRCYVQFGAVGWDWLTLSRISDLKLRLNSRSTYDLSLVNFYEPVNWFVVS